VKTKYTAKISEQKKKDEEMKTGLIVVFTACLVFVGSAPVFATACYGPAPDYEWLCDEDQSCDCACNCCGPGYWDEEVTTTGTATGGGY